MEEYSLNRNNNDDELYKKFKKFMLDSDMPKNRTIRSSNNEEEIFAKDKVSNMYHCEYGNRYIGEKYSIDKAKEVLYKYKDIIPDGVSCYEVYMAINAQYHDYSKLFKSWFGDNIDSKIIDSAIIFWFKDDDYKSDSKVLKYFNY